MRKDASLCVVTVDRILDIQWQKLTSLYEQEQRAIEAQAAARAAAALQDAGLQQEMKDAEAAAPSARSDDAYPESGIGMKWPLRLHLTFDNAAGECKNQWMFRYLGLLVLHDVVQAITVSTLLVGHTHDIVDQLFSIWARMLRIHNAETYEKMRAVFRDRYISRIQGLVDLMKKRGAQAAEHLSEEERSVFREHQEGASAVDWRSEAGEILQNFTNFVKVTFKEHAAELSPHIELQSVSIDVQGWLQRCMHRKLPELSNLDLAHNFGIEKDADGTVYLYNKHLCDSTERSNEAVKVQHRYRGQLTGDYTTRAKLYEPGAQQLADPFKTPPLHIETDKLRTTALKFAQQHVMTSQELSSFEAMLDRIEQAREEQAKVCAECADLANIYCGHGVVHRPRWAGEEEKQAARQKSSSRAKAWKNMIAHLYDPAYADAHNKGQVHVDWWTKWRLRVHKHILPARIARGMMADPSVLAAPFHPHPTQLVSNEGELPCVAEPGRVDLRWLAVHGIPRVGQMVVLRSSDPREPFYIGLIRSVRGLTQAAHAEIAAVKAAEATRAAECKQAEAAAAAKAAAAAAAAPALVNAFDGRRAATGRRPLGGLHDAALSLKQFEVDVVYWDLHPKDWEDMHFYVDGGKTTKKRVAKCNAWWAKQFAAHGSTLEQVQAELDQATHAQLPPPPAKSWIVDLYRGLSYVPQLQAEDADVTQYNGTTLIVWGDIDDILCKGKHCAHTPGGKAHKMRESTWGAVRRDLTEQLEDPAAAIERAGQPAAAAAVDAGIAYLPSPFVASGVCRFPGAEPGADMSDVEVAPARTAEAALIPAAAATCTPPRARA